MHQVGVALGCDQVLGRLAFPARVERRPGTAHGLGRQDVVANVVVAAHVREALLTPAAVHHVEPFAGAGVAIVVLVEVHTIFRRFVFPPAGDDVQRQPAVRDVVDVSGLLGQQRRVVKGGPHRHHQLKTPGYGGQRRRSRPGIERRCLDALDVVQVQLGDQRQVEAPGLGPDGEVASVLPRSGHAFVLDVAQPAAKYRHPVAVAHQRTPAKVSSTSAVGDAVRLRWMAAASASSQSASRTKGSKPTTFSPSATKFESALIS